MTSNQNKIAIKLGLLVLVSFLLISIAQATSVGIYTNGASTLEGIVDENDVYLLGDGTSGSDIYQIMGAGPDNQIDPPSATGGPTDDDLLIYQGYCGDDGSDPNQGTLYKELIVDDGQTSRIYVRAWNSSTSETATRYGNSELYVLQGTVFPNVEYWDVAGSAEPAFKTDQVFDIIAPGPPLSFEASPEADGDIYLSWVNTNESDFVGTMIRFKTTAYPTNETDGLLVTNSIGGTGESRSFTDSPLVWNTTYYYSGFSYDGANNYSSPATTAETSIDELDPQVTLLAPDGGEIWVGGTTHAITWIATEEGNSGFSSTGITLRYSTNSGSTWNLITQESNSGSYNWLLPSVTSTTCRISIEATDRAGNFDVDMSNADFTIDSTPPGVTSIEVKDRTSGETVRSNERWVTVEAFGVSPEAVQMRLAQDAAFSVNNTGWIAYTAITEYQLTAGDGSKTVYYQVRDAASNESGSVNDDIILDATGPSSATISINSGAYATREVNVNLTLTATDEWTPLEMNISNEASFPAVNWESFAASKGWTLIAGDGTKEVRVRYRDGGGNTTEASDSIVYDATPPSVTVSSPNGGENWGGGSVHNITWTATDGGSGFIGNSITIYYTTNEGQTWNYIDQVSNSGTYPWTVPLLTTDECRVSIEAVDRAGNINRDLSNNTFEINSTAPTVSSIEVKDRSDGNNQYTNERPVTIEAYGVVGDSSQMIIAQDAGFTVNSTGWISYANPCEYQVTTGDGGKTVYYKLRDTTGSFEGGTVSNSITLDTTGPSSASISINNGAAATSEVNVTLSLAATDGWAPLEMNISNEASFPSANWEAFNSTKAWILTAGEGAKTVYVRYRDGGGNTTSEVSDGIILGALPMVASIEVKDRDSGDTIRTNDPVISLEAFGVVNEHEMMIWDGDSTGWITYESPTEYTLSSSNGDKTVYYQLRDITGNFTSETVTDNIILDTLPPTGINITINDGVISSTTEAQVNLTLTATDEWAPIEMNISTEASFPDGNWETFSAAKIWQLPDSDGTWEVFVSFRDGGMNQSGTVKDDIYLDVTPPTIISYAPGTAEGYVTLSATIEAVFSEPMDQAAVEAGFFITPEVSGSFTWRDSQTLVFIPAVLLQRGVTYEVTLTESARDLIGNSISPAPFSWTFNTVPDTIPPTITNYMINSNRLYSGDIISTTPRVSAIVLDEGKADRIYRIELLVDGVERYHGTNIDWQGATYEADGDGYFEYVLPTMSEGTHSITIRAYDFALNPTQEAYSQLRAYGAGAGLDGPVMNHPNPFSPLRGENTQIAYSLTDDANVALYIYDINGNLRWKKYCQAGVETTSGSGVGAGGRRGYNEVTFNGVSAFGEVLGNGIYIIRVVDVEENKVLGTGKITVLD